MLQLLSFCLGKLLIMANKNYPDKMKAIVAYAPGDYKYETVDTPVIENAKEIVVKVEACGMNLHSQQGTICSEITRSPISKSVTSSPLATIRAINSCPGIIGALIYDGCVSSPQKLGAPPYALILAIVNESVF